MVRRVFSFCFFIVCVCYWELINCINLIASGRRQTLPRDPYDSDNDKKVGLKQKQKPVTVSSHLFGFKMLLCLFLSVFFWI